MVTFDKREIANVLLLNKLAEQRNVEEKLRNLSHKYKMNFEEFFKKTKSSKSEKFERWDDYMEWKALVNVYKELTAKIKALRNGHYKIA